MDAENAKTFGIIGGFIISSFALLLNFFSTLRSVRAQKISNYQEIIKSHRDIWRLTLEDPINYTRLFESNIDLIEKPITHQERLFLQLLFLHASAAYTYLKHSHMQPIEQLENDFYEVLLMPIPRIIWMENKKYHNADFRHFVETINKPKGIKGIIDRMYSEIKPDYTKIWNVLLLTSFPDTLVPIIKRLGDNAICLSDADKEISLDYICKNKIDYIVCFGYGRILKKDILSKVACINIHGGFLPYNRGPNPNLWAWIDDTKKGVSIHYIDEGIDTGDIIAQCEIKFQPPISLQTSFDQTIAECKRLFAEEWPKIRSGKASRFKQQGSGSSHTLGSQKALEKLFSDGSIHLPITQFCERAHVLLKRTKNII